MLIMLKDGHEHERTTTDANGQPVTISEGLVVGKCIYKDDKIIVLNNGKYNETFQTKDIEHNLLCDF